MDYNQDGQKPGTTGFSAMRRVCMAEDDHDELDLVAKESDVLLKPTPPNVRRDGSNCLIASIFEAAVPLDVRIRLTAETLAVVVTVPDPSWIVATERFFSKVLGGWLVYGHASTDRKSFGKADGHEVAEALARGRSVLAITDDASALPAALLATADIRIVLPPPDPAMLADAIERFTGQHAIVPIEVGTIDIRVLLAAFRPGSSPSEIIERLCRRSSTVDDTSTGVLPDLYHAVEYGDARLWALDLVKDYQAYQRGELRWSDLDATALVHGAPGLGKTFLASMLAQKLGVKLVTLSIGELFTSSSGYLDGVLRAFRDTVSMATPPALLFWDEVDALPSRATMDPRSASFWSSVVTEVLIYLDGEGPRSRKPGVAILAATNYPEKIDPALRRPGRFEKVIEIVRPDAAGVRSILSYHLRGDLAGEDLDVAAQLLDGSSPAEIMQVVKTARRAARNDRRTLSLVDLQAAAVPTGSIDPRALRRISIHEAGHAVVAMELGSDEIVRIVVGSVRGAAGHTLFRRSGDLETRTSIEARVITQLGGRAAECVFCSEACSGSGGSDDADIAFATAAIAALHFSQGLRGQLTYLAPTDATVSLLRHDPSLRPIVEKRLQELHRKAVDIVTRRRAAVEAIADALADRRYLTGAEAQALFDVDPAHSEPNEETPEC